jgi:hypothetical protein
VRFQIREPDLIRPWICADRNHTNALSSRHEDLAEVIGRAALCRRGGIHSHFAQII